MVIVYNCSKCPDYKNNKCDGNLEGCICIRCPRNLGQCIIVRFCKETESIIYFED